MSAGWRIGRVAGIEIAIHPSWLVIALLLTYSLAAFQFPNQFRGWSPGLYWAVGVATALLFFVSVLAHELSHALVARRFALPVTRITLFIFGGATQIEGDAGQPRQEALMAAAGPAMSLAIGLILLGLAQLVNQVQLVALLGWLGVINVLLAIFNLIPGFPMDGGRILRAVLWRLSGDRLVATRNAGTVGRLIAYAMIGFGVFLALQPGGLIGGLWLALIGWFLSNAAEATVAQVGVERSLRGIRVGQVMDTAPPWVSPNETVAEHLEARGVPTLYRIHEDPDPVKVEEFEEFIGALGYSLAGPADHLAPRHFQSLVQKIHGKPEEKPIAMLMLRTMQKARYDATPVLIVNAAAPTLFALIIEHAGWLAGQLALIAASGASCAAMEVMARWYRRSRR